MKIDREGSKVQRNKATKVYPHFILEMTTLCKNFATLLPIAIGIARLKIQTKQKLCVLAP